MSKQFTVIDGVTYDNSKIDLSKVDRSKREAWKMGKNNVVEIDEAKAKEIMIVRVKREAERRILEIMPVYKQRNNLAKGMVLTTLHGSDTSKWPEDSKQEYGEVISQWSQIEAIRSKSTQIEAMTPIPADYSDDKYW
jgi:hypothetical protein